MTQRRLVIAMLGVAIAATLAFLLVPRITGGPERHLDGQGPLGSTDDPASVQAMGFDADKPAGWRVTAGIQLCLAQGDQPAVLDGSVTPTKTAGTNGITLLGAYVRQFVPSEGGRPIGGVDVFPPTVPEVLHPVKGFVVSVRCMHPNPDPNLQYVELDLGFARGSAALGGGWVGVDVGYTSGGHHHVVSLGYYFFACGPDAPQQFCAGASPSP